MLISQACGDSSFTDMVRTGVINSVDNLAIEFVETEYRPPVIESSLHPPHPSRTLLRGRRGHRESQDTEMQNLTASTSDEESMYSVALSSDDSSNV